MSETDLAKEAPDTEANDATDSEPISAGGMLRQARENMHLDINVLASTLKVPVSKIKALEDARLDQLPDLTFTRALAATICRNLHIDPAPVLAKLPTSNRVVSDISPGINAPYRLSPQTNLSKTPSSTGRYAWLIGGLVVAAVLVVLLPDFTTSPTATVRTPNASQPVDSGGLAETSDPAGNSAFAEAPAATSSDAPVGQQSELNMVTAQATAPRASAATSAAVTTPHPAASAIAATSPAVRLTTSKDSWLRITDANGKALINRVLKAGETADLNGAAPYKVEIGNIDGLSLLVRGKPFDFSTVTKTNTARFELN